MEKKSAKQQLETATFGAGCFWGVEEDFRKTPGVVETQVGYAGGSTPNPTYQEVCTDATGHAEVVQVEFDPSKVSFNELLNKFWELHDPTQVDRQGPDCGTQYRSVIFYHSKQQKEAAEKSKKLLEKSGKFGISKIATQIVAAKTFYKAEGYHQQYLAKRGLKVCH